MYKKLSLTITSVLFCSTAFASSNFDISNISFSGLKSNTDLSSQMLNQQDVVGKSLYLLKNRQDNTLSKDALYIGGSAQIYSSYAPSSYNKGGNKNSVGHYTATEKKHSGTYIKMPYANVYVASTIGSFVTGYAQLQTSDESTSNVILPQAYFIIGDLSKTDFYLTLGKSVVEFGRFNQVTNFNPTMTRAFFMQYGANAAVSYAHNGFDTSFSVANGSGLAVNNMNGDNRNQINAYTFDTKYKYALNDTDYISAGAGFTNATSFTNSNKEPVGAIDFNLLAKIDKITLSGEFLLTTSGVNGYQGYSNGTPVQDQSAADAFGLTNNPVLMTSGIFGADGSSLIDFESGATVKGVSLQAQYDGMLSNKKIIYYTSYSQVMQNAQNGAWMLEAGTRYNAFDSVWVGGAYTYAGSRNAEVDNMSFLGYGTNVLSADITAYF